jgi:serine/threonine protein phosphatase PrpC
MEEGTIRLDGSAADEPAQPTLRWISASASDVGKVRKVNEDALLESPQIGLWAVADGVGGASAGDWASALTVETLGRVAKPTTMSGFLADVYDQLGRINGALRQQAAAEAHHAIATTIVALLFAEQHFACVWAGDSRLYLLRNGRLRQINHDHSEVQEMVDRGILRPAEARHHPRGNIVTRAVGAYEKLDLEMAQDLICEGDLFLLCSDGLTKTMDDDEIAGVLALPVEQVVDALIQTALNRGAPDNVTVVAVKVLAAGTSA